MHKPVPRTLPCDLNNHWPVPDDLGLDGKVDFCTFFLPSLVAFGAAVEAHDVFLYLYSISPVILYVFLDMLRRHQ
jgi:hypothetical protein